MELKLSTLDKLWATLIEFGSTWGIRLIGVLVALIIAFIIAGMFSRALIRSLEKRNFDLTLTRFFGALVRYIVLGGAVMGCLGVFGIETASFAAVIAAIGLAIGLALAGHAEQLRRRGDAAGLPALQDRRPDQRRRAAGHRASSCSSSPPT